MNQLMRHIADCNDADLPGARLEFRVGRTKVGWVTRSFARALADFTGIAVGEDSVTLAEAAASDLPAIACGLAARGLYRWRGEAFDVRATPGGTVLSQIDRGALPAFGIMAEGVHVNGLVRRADGVHVWVAKRAADKALDPGKFDHIVAGGIPAGLTPAETLVKEAGEEAAIPAELSASAVWVADIGYAMDRPEGLRRDMLHCYDLVLPADFTPRAEDGEVESFSLWPIDRVLDAVRLTDDFKFNVNLVLIDLFLRQGLVPAPEAAALRAALG